jgi:hypothetical protein
MFTMSLSARVNSSRKTSAEIKIFGEVGCICPRTQEEQSILRKGIIHYVATETFK